MSAKTYAPTFIYLLRKLCIYIARYRNTLIGGLTDFGVTNAAAKVDAVLAACEAIMDEYDRPIEP